MMSLNTPLLPHQRTAADKLAPLRVGALFMDMGTGKSRTAIELAVRRRGRFDHVVWLCPVSLKATVRAEIHKHLAGASVYVFDDKTRSDNLPDADWHVAGIESVAGSDRVVFALNAMVTDRTFLIVDESSYIKGYNALRTKRITEIGKRARYRMILTGTPMSQGVVDLFAQFKFLSPKILGYSSFYTFAHNHLEYSEKYPGLIVRAHNTEHLAAKIAPYTYQITKEDALDLPAKLYEGRWVDLTPEQAHWYDRIKERFLEEIDPDDWDSIVIFRLFSALQQVACGFWNGPEDEGGRMEFHHNRMEMLLETVERLPDEPVIIWAKYHHDIDGITAALADAYGPENVCRFTGGESEKVRDANVERFRGGARFFVATQAAGGHGLTLNEARYAIFYSNGFKYSERIQAEDRCHRIGQERRVTYIDITAACGIERRIMDALSSKGDAVERFRREVKKVKDRRELIASL